MPRGQSISDALVRSDGTTRDAVWSANAPFGRVFLMVKLHASRAMASERPPIPFRRVSVASRRHENARSELSRGHQHATRRPQRPSGPALRGFGSREGGTNGVFGGGCQPRRATDVSASETWWSERVRAAMGPRERKDERGAHTRALVERARPRSQGPRAREDERGAHTRAQRARGRARTPQPASTRSASSAACRPLAIAPLMLASPT
jgi:hypothetical protein